MTCIVGLVSQGRVVMGADSQSTSGWQRVVLASPKVIRNGELLIGSSGSVRVANLLRVYPIEVSRQPDMPPFEFLAKYVADSLRALFRDAGVLSAQHGIDHIGGNDENANLIIGYRGCLYRMASDFSVTEFVQSYYAIGSGDDYALGSLHSTESLETDGVITPEQRVMMALEAAAAFSIGVSGPFVIESLPAGPQKQWMEDAPVVRYPFETVHNGYGVAR